MKLGYSKMKENNNSNNNNNNNNPFPQRSRSRKEYAFLDQDVEHRLYRKKSQNHQNQTPTTPTIEDHEDDEEDKSKSNSKKDEMKGGGRVGGERKLASLRRNFSVSSATTTAYQKNRGNNGQIERQSSTRTIQGAVKRAFSMGLRRSTSTSSDRYCRIYDQSSTLDHDHDDHDHDDYDHNDDCEKTNDGENDNGSRSKKKNHVGSKVFRACKRLFSR